MNLRKNPAQGTAHLVRLIEAALLDDSEKEGDGIDSIYENPGEIEVALASKDCCYRTYIITVRPK